MAKQRFTDISKEETIIIQNIIKKKEKADLPSNETINNNNNNRKSGNPAQYYADNLGNMSVNLDDVK